MNIYKVKWSGNPESLHHINEFSLLKNGKEEWNIKSFYGHQFYEIETTSGDIYTVKRRGFFSRAIDIDLNGKKLYSIKGKVIKLGEIKLWLDSRDFLYLDGQQLCSVDAQSRGWNWGENVALMWQHDNIEYEVAINMLGLYVLRHPTWW